MLDTDLIVWDSISHLINAKLMALHSEPLGLKVYVPKAGLQTPPEFVWDDLDWTVSPCNAAVLHYGANKIKNYFSELKMETK